ncbi:MAG TPA: DUF5985 family protein [Burkholderiales bacterium]|jgi:hypothetical protein|nr:DUF5985 family protein [Burkholderiales bacterium]
MGAFSTVLYLLAVITSLGCMVLLFRAYGASGFRLLLWSGLCFIFLSVNNVLLFADLVVFPAEIDLRPYRLVAALVGVLFLLYGFIWEAE